MSSLVASDDGWSARTGIARTVALAVFAVLPLSGAAASAGGTAFWCLALLGLGLLCAGRSTLKWSDPAVRWLLLAIGLPVALNAASVLYFGLLARQFSWSPFIGAALILLAVHYSGVSTKPLIAGAALACFTLLFMTTLAVAGFGHERPSLTMNALLYGKIAAFSMVVVAWGIGEESNRQWRTLWYLSLAAGLAALLLTGYRGGWVVLPLVLLALWLNRGRSPIRSPKLTQVLSAGLVLAMVMTIFAVNSTVLERVHKISNEVQLYQRGVIDNSSIGSRMAMWKAASQVFRENPVFGVGTHEFQSQLKRLQDQGDYPRDAKLYRHAHNTYLNIAAEYGLIGLAVMLVALAALLKLCLGLPRGLKSLALLMMASWMLMALSNDLFAHQSLMRVMSLGFAVCLGVGLRQLRIGA